MPAVLPSPLPMASRRRPSVSPGTAGSARTAASSANASTSSPMSAHTRLFSASARLAGVCASTLPSQRGWLGDRPMSSQVWAPPSASMTSNASVSRAAVAPAPPGTSFGPRPARFSGVSSASAQADPLPWYSVSAAPTVMARTLPAGAVAMVRRVAGRALSRNRTLPL